MSATEVAPIPESPERKLQRVAQRLGALKEHPGFVALVDEVEKKRGRMKAMMLQRLEGKESIETLKEQTTYDRGFIDGMRYLQAVVNGAASKLAEWEAGAEVTEPEEEKDGWAGYGT